MNDLPAPPGVVPLTGTESELAPAKRRRPWIIAGVAAAVIIVVIAAVVVVAVVENKDSLPDQVAGLDRLHTPNVQALEDTLDQIKLGEVRIEMAVYGTGGEEELILFRYSNFPTAPSISSLVRGAGGGIVGSGGTVDFDAQSVETRDGFEYRCMPFVGRLFPGDVSEASGQVCAWAEGDEYALLMDVRAQDAGSAISEAVAAHEALS